MYTARKNLTYMYSESKGKAFIDTLSQATSLTMLLEEIKRVEDIVVKICGLKK